MKSKLLYTTALITFAGLVVFGVNQVQAQDNFARGPQNLIEKLVTRFNLNQNEVESVFEEVRTERQSQMQQAFQDRLTKAVSDGKMSEAQKQLIIAKHEELQSKREAIRDQNLDREDHREAMQEVHEELETWAEQNGIDPSLFMGGMNRGMGKGKMGGRGMGRSL